MSTKLCCVCNHDMSSSSLAEWCHQCPECKTWASNLPVAVNDTHNALDEVLRERALSHLRESNNRQILARLSALGVQPGMTLLDVGCAHGWFLETAAQFGLQTEGIEPDSAVAAQAGSTGRPIRGGFFPDVLSAEERFDVISFNDVLEHIPNVWGAISACSRHLRPGGFLSINIPSSQGLVFRLAVALRYRGLVKTLFERLWQVGLPSPHLWYFDAAGLTRLCQDQGFELILSDVLPSVSRSGLWERAHFDRRPSPLTVSGVAVAAASAPILNSRFASDIMHLVFRRTD